MIYDEEEYEALFHEYPSWVFYTCHLGWEGFIDRKKIDFLLRADFESEKSFSNIDANTIERIRESLVAALKSPELRTWNEMAVIFSMLGLSHPLLHNSRMERYGPYQLDHRGSTVLLDSALLANMKRLYPTEWNSIFDVYVNVNILVALE